ncbi:LOW QUALITY PROTEIN: gamma-glutamylaminecyclotransferase [Xyrichtys novacula]|uniref:Gamma-glutamylaminecyclotransferase n=1 Tax=Xyrichtys novacula TaxID=13765 RepID=A0AAV1HNM4_XYRNO|nr:LOW QUALITY PROTEIN: gamma-glutamylaminecyclotransferase [Xyrichtys novacula]
MKHRKYILDTRPPVVVFFSIVNASAHVQSPASYPADRAAEFKQTPVFSIRLSSCVHMTHVFVYGTLKRGQPNNYRMFKSSNGKAELLASACTTEKYPLIIATKHNIPFLLNLPGQGHRVRGEIYKVDDKMLAFLDDFESCPSMYQRTVVKLEVEEWLGVEEKERLAVGSITEAFVYSTTAYQPDWPSLSSYADYDAYGDHGLEYETRESRERRDSVEEED